MFLVEAALGKQHSITKDDWTIKAPPAGFDSVVARGQQVGAAWRGQRLYVSVVFDLTMFFQLCRCLRLIILVHFFAAAL